MVPKLKSFDHAALMVRDLEISAQWYEKVLGLKRIQVEEWGPYPLFMLAPNNTGLAIFPSKSGNPLKSDAKIPHFAFEVDKENFKAFQKHFKALNIHYDFQDHAIDHSIYFRDPDNYLIEITLHLTDHPID